MPIRAEQARTTRQLIEDGYRPENMRPANPELFQAAYIENGLELDRALKSLGLKRAKPRKLFVGVISGLVITIGSVAGAWIGLEFVLHTLTAAHSSGVIR